MKIKGIVKNNVIEILDSISLTEGTEVVIEISDNTNTIRNQDNQWQKLQKVIGSWKDDSEINAIFNNLDEERHQYRGRNVNFEDFS